MAIQDETVQAVWENARASMAHDPSQWRQDRCGAWLHRDHYDNAQSEFGWRILNITPGTAERMDELQAFHHANDFDVASGRAMCRVSADRGGLTPDQWVDQPRNKLDRES